MYPIQKVVRSLNTLNQVMTSFFLYDHTLTHSVYRAVCDALSIHSSVGHVPSHSYHHYPESYNHFPAGPTHQPTYHQPSHPGYPPPGHQYPPRRVSDYECPPPTQLSPTDSSHHSSFPSHQYTGAQVQQLSFQGNICCSTIVLSCWVLGEAQKCIVYGIVVVS